MQKTSLIFLNALPVLIMIALIPLVANDYVLAIGYAIIVVVAFTVKKEQNDLLIFVFGLCAMIVSEYLFIKTGVETFNRASLLGIMPVWLPILWGYGFVAIKRAVEILKR
jgi:hypothetical protein